MRNIKKLEGPRYWAFVGSFVALIGAALYPIYIYPVMHIQEYKKIQEINREGIKQEDIQPGGMRVWRDPFDRK